MVKTTHLSWLLRHCKEVGEHVDDHGFISLDTLNSLSRKKYTIQELYHHVNSDKKGRFETYERDGQVFIRAVQGHSFHVKDPGYHIEPDVKVMYHLTHHDHVQSILDKGLLKMGRQYIHFWPSLQVVKITRIRDIPLEVRVPLGTNVYRTSNGYYLTDVEIPPEFIKVVEK